MHVAEAAGAISATLGSLAPFSSFPSNLSETNATHRKASFHWLSYSRGSDG